MAGQTHWVHIEARGGRSPRSQSRTIPDPPSFFNWVPLIARDQKWGHSKDFFGLLSAHAPEEASLCVPLPLRVCAHL